MKKSLLYMASALLALPAVAQEEAPLMEPAVWPNQQIVNISPDGKYAFGDLFGVIAIFDLEKGTMVEYGDQENAADSYAMGAGNLFSTTGVVIANQGEPSVPVYRRGGEWTALNVPGEGLSNVANSITADGTVIVGAVGMRKVSLDDGPTPMLVPAIWELQSDGSYSDAVLLPYPEKDITGAVPQYVMLIGVSDDGRKAVGIQTSNNGMLQVPYLFSKSDEGEWSWSEICPDLINPNHYEIPENPGDGPAWVNPEDYLTEEELEAYNAAMNAYDNGELDDYPMYPDYMNEEERAAYEAAVAEYEKANLEWNLKFTAFMDVFDKVMAESVTPTMNNLMISPDGKRALTTSSIEVELEEPGPWGQTTGEASVPVLYNLEDNSAKVYRDYQNYSATSFDKDYNIYCKAVVGSWMNPPMYEAAYVCPNGGDNFVTLEKFISPINSEVANWVKQNMYHGYESFDEETEEFTYMNVPYTGTPRAAADGSTLSCMSQVLWEDDDPSLWIVSYTLPLFKSSGVRTANVGQFDLRALRGGRLMVAGDVKNVTVYDLNGRVVFSGTPVSSIVETGLAGGVYVVKATDANGAVKSMKAMM